MHDQSGGLVIKRFINRCRRLAGLRIELNMLQLNTRVLHIGVDNFEILRVHGAAGDHLRSLRYSFRHQHGLGERGRPIVHRRVRDFHSR